MTTSVLVLVLVGIPILVVVLGRQFQMHRENTRLTTRLTTETERHRAAEGALADAQRVASLGSFEVDPVNHSTTWSAEQFRILGYEPGEVDSSLATFVAHLHPDDAKTFLDGIDATSPAAPTFTTEVRITTVQGERRWLTGSATRIWDASGALVRTHGTTQDVTDRREAEDALRVTADQLNSAQRTAHLGSWEWDVQANVSVWSDELFRICGLEPGEIEPSTAVLFGLVHPDDRAALAHANLDVVRLRRFGDLVLRIVRASGELRWILLQGSSVVDEAGDVAKVVGSVLDVTETRRADSELHAAQELFAQGFRHSPVGMAMVDRDGVVFQANAALCRIMGRRPDEMVGRVASEQVHPDDVELAASLRQRIQAGADSAQVELRYLRPDGSSVWTHVTSSVVNDERGEGSFVFAQVLDIDDRKRAELALASASGPCRSCGSTSGRLRLDREDAVEAGDLEDLHGVGPGPA